MCDYRLIPYREKQRISKKERKCFECGISIDKSEFYIDRSGFDNDSNKWKRFDMCLRCKNLEIEFHNGDSYIFGELYEELDFNIDFEMSFEEFSNY